MVSVTVNSVTVNSQCYSKNSVTVSTHGTVDEAAPSYKGSQVTSHEKGMLTSLAGSR